MLTQQIQKFLSLFNTITFTITITSTITSVKISIFVIALFIYFKS